MSAPVVTCPLCGHSYDPAGLQACAACPLHAGCLMTCCPACGYTAIDPNRSALMRWLAGMLGRRTTPRWSGSGRRTTRGWSRSGRRTTRGRSGAQRTAADGPEPDLMLAELSPGDEASVVGFEGLAADRRAQLQAYGLAPDRRLRVVQQRPVTVLLVDHTELAIEADLARGVRVRRPPPLPALIP